MKTFEEVQKELQNYPNAMDFVMVLDGTAVKLKLNANWDYLEYYQETIEVGKAKTVAEARDYGLNLAKSMGIRFTKGFAK